jgi:hypothetical protein
MNKGSEFGPGRVKNVHFSISPRPVLGPIQPMGTGGSLPGEGERSGRCMKLTTHLEVVWKSRYFFQTRKQIEILVS